ncbi:hypothetical protein C8R46DRAFT_1102629 [Mycena filopes]|nr:hypothetical protein C8R46DRAFT_1102629 [Mycena filopes]
MAQPISETQSEFSLKPTRPGTAPASATSTTSREFSRRSLGQKRRREREAQENVKPVASASSSSRRSLAQQARRQRELAAAMERELTGAESSDANVRSNAQKFRRQVEAAERRLDIAPNCDSSEALARILDFNVDNFGKFRRESYRDRMRRLYRPGY